MKKTKNKLYAFGCSFTDDNYVTRMHPEMDCSWPKWPEILGKKLGLQSVNRGESGSGNDSIYHNAISSIINDHEEIDTICILWTNVWRYRIGQFFFNPRSVAVNAQSRPQSYQQKIERITMEMIDYNRKGIWESTFYGFLYDYQNLQPLCKKFDIRLVSWCGCSFLNLGKNSKNFSEDTRKIIVAWYDAINSNKYPLQGAHGGSPFSNLEKFLDEKDIIGWPFVSDLGGDSYSEIIRSGRPSPPKVHYSRLAYSISEKDNHPNAKGHELIAETFWEHMK